jgi:WD40 repeat protein
MVISWRLPIRPGPILSNVPSALTGGAGRPAWLDVAWRISTMGAPAELALASRGVSLQVPIALAVESLRTAPVLEGDLAIRHAIRRAARQRSRLDHGDTVWAVAFSPDGSRVATGSGDDSARVFDATTGAELSRLDHSGAVYEVVFSPDGTRVATGSFDDSARVFEATTGTELGRLNHGGTVWAVAFSPDGTKVATGGFDRNARVWVVDHGQLIKQAEGRLVRNLTQQEWRRFFPGRSVSKDAG